MGKGEGGRMRSNDGLYMVQEMGTGRVKIGRTGNLSGRLATLRCANPSELVVVLWVEGAGWLEKTMHGAFAEHCVGSEWFEPVGNVERFVTMCAEWVRFPLGPRRITDHVVLELLGKALSGVITTREFEGRHGEPLYRLGA